MPRIPGLPFSLRLLPFLLFPVMACAANPEPGSGPAQQATTAADDLRTASAEDYGLATAPLEAMTAAIRAGEQYRNVHALLIAKEGQLVYEEYFAGEDVHRGRGGRRHVVFDRDTLHDLRSVTKSVVSALVASASRTPTPRTTKSAWTGSPTRSASSSPAPW